jgi:hypothetical protein
MLSMFADRSCNNKKDAHDWLTRHYFNTEHFVKHYKESIIDNEIHQCRVYNTFGQCDITIYPNLY